jgi:hypothetical protein
MGEEEVSGSIGTARVPVSRLVTRLEVEDLTRRRLWKSLSSLR